VAYCLDVRVQRNIGKFGKIQSLGSTRVEPNRFHFSKKIIQALQPGDSRYYVHDDTIRGLALTVYPSGKKSFVLYRKLSGRPERVFIGSYPDLTPEQARRMAEQMNAIVAQGGNPARERREIKAEMTLQELFDTFLLLYAKGNKRTWQNDQLFFERYLRVWKLRKLSSITRQDVIALHSHIGRVNGQYAANRAIALLRAMWSRANQDWGLRAINPAEKIRFFKERKRERFLDGTELPRFFRALELEPNGAMRDLFLLSLFTGARRSNVQSMRWEEINWNRAEWRIPAEKAKGDEPITIALAPPATDILARRKASSLSEWVFPSRGASGHLVEPKTAWARILKRAHLTDVRMHDLRRTLGSWQAALGTSLPIIGKSLGHASLQATAIYSRLNLDPVRVSVTNAVNAMLALKGQEN
jgi:integrase